MRVLLLVFVVFSGLFLSSCFGCDRLAQKVSERAAEKVIESASGGEVDVDFSEGNVKIEGQDGNTAHQFGVNSEMPADWPAEFPPYPGAKVTSSHNSTDNDKVFMSASLTTGDPVSSVMEFYSGKASAAGYTSRSKFTGSGQSNDVYVNDEFDFSVSSGSSETETFITLAFQSSDLSTGEADAAAVEGGDSGSATAEGSANGSESLEAGAEDAGSASAGEGEANLVADTTGSIPEGFPVQVLKPYDNGKVTAATMSEDNYTLIQETADNRETVVAFYDDHFTGRGWTVESSVDVPNTSMRGYRSSGGEIFFSAMVEKGQTQITLNYAVKK